MIISHNWFSESVRRHIQKHTQIINVNVITKELCVHAVGSMSYNLRRQGLSETP